MGNKRLNHDPPYRRYLEQAFHNKNINAFRLMGPIEFPKLRAQNVNFHQKIDESKVLKK